MEELEVLATGCTAGASGMPGSGGLSDKTAIAGQIADCKTLIETKRLVLFCMTKTTRKVGCEIVQNIIRKK